MTFQESIKEFIRKGYTPEDNTCNGKCSKCGECCGIILPIDQEDANRIQEYVVKHKIFPQKHLRIMTNKWQCPFYSGNKEKGCSIYEARPKICRIFQCDKTPNIDDLIECKNAIPVDMWAFAKAIEKEMKKNKSNK